MTKNKYLNLRQIDNKLAIMHAYHNENVGLAILSFDEFRHSLTVFIKKQAVETGVNEQQIFNNMYDEAIDYFDSKHQVVYLIITREKVITETITIVRR